MMKYRRLSGTIVVKMPQKKTSPTIEKNPDLCTCCTSLGCHVTIEVYSSIYLFNVYSVIVYYLAKIIRIYFRLK